MCRCGAPGGRSCRRPPPHRSCQTAYIACSIGVRRPILHAASVSDGLYCMQRRCQEAYIAYSVGFRRPILHAASVSGGLYCMQRRFQEAYIACSVGVRRPTLHAASVSGGPASQKKRASAPPCNPRARLRGRVIM
eukprot:363414-Chlamydomonas_euryale.AAC.3